MSNVFTKRSHKPRTTTLRDFCGEPRPNAPRRPRVLSPTRRCNPHPTGLVSQSPYNKDHTTFDIWNPDFAKIGRRMPDMQTHQDFQNFCSGPLKRGNKSKVAPEIHYSLTTTMRMNYQQPEFPQNVPHEQRFTRFGYTPYKSTMGIVPTALPPIYDTTTSCLI